MRENEVTTKRELNLDNFCKVDKFCHSLQCSVGRRLSLALDYKHKNFLHNDVTFSSVTVSAGAPHMQRVSFQNRIEAICEWRAFSWNEMSMEGISIDGITRLRCEGKIPALPWKPPLRPTPDSDHTNTYSGIDFWIISLIHWDFLPITIIFLFEDDIEKCCL